MVFLQMILMMIFEQERYIVNRQEDRIRETLIYMYVDNHYLFSKINRVISTFFLHLLIPSSPVS